MDTETQEIIEITAYKCECKYCDAVFFGLDKGEASKKYLDHVRNHCEVFKLICWAKGLEYPLRTEIT